MDIKQTIKNIGKYHYLIVIGKKVATLSNGNDSTKTKKECIDIIKKKIDVLKNKYIVKIVLEKLKKKDIVANNKSKLKSIGGPILIKIRVFQISNNGKLKMNDNEDRNNGLFITEKYLKKHNEIRKKDLHKIAYKIINRKISNNLLTVNIIDKILK